MPVFIGALKVVLVLSRGTLVQEGCISANRACTACLFAFCGANDFGHAISAAVLSPTKQACSLSEVKLCVGRKKHKNACFSQK